MKNNALQNVLKNALTFLLIFLVVNYLISLFTGNSHNQEQLKSNTLTFVTDKKEFSIHEPVSATLQNNTNESITIPFECPQTFFYQNANWQEKTSSIPLICNKDGVTEVKAGQKHQIKFLQGNNSIFNELGNYKLTLHLGDQTLESNQFEIKPQGFLAWLWTTLFYQPLYNTLVFIISVLPNHDLGFAIIILTLIIRTLLLIPSQKALKSQKKLQDLQPLLAELKTKHGNDQQRLAQETMALYKEYKVNPLGSCLPLIIQLPVLIALFYAVQNGLSPDNTSLLYGGLRNFDITKVQTIFLGILDLTKINFLVLPLIVGLLQFIQLKLSTSRKPQVKSEDTKKPSEMEIMNKSMQLVMPVMIALFTASVPAGVGLYWSFSTLYGIGQQIVVNRQKEQNQTVIEVAPQKKNDKKIDNNDKITKIKV